MSTLPTVIEAVSLPPNPSPTNDEILADYLAGKRSDRTRKIYSSAIREFFAIAGNRPLADIARSELADYASAVTGALDAGAAKSTVALRVQAVRGFLRWAHEESLFPVTPARVGRMIERPRIDGQKQFPVLTEAQAAKLLASASTARDRALLAVMLGAGLRVAELAALNIESLKKRPDGRLRLSVQGKGRKARDAALPRESASLLLAYLSETDRTLSDTGALFLSNDRARKGDGRLTTRTIGRIVNEVARSAGIEGEAISPHALRHTAAVHWLRSGLEVHEVARLLGHSSIVVTQRYVDHIQGEELEAKIPPLIGGSATTGSP